MMYCYLLSVNLEDVFRKMQVAAPIMAPPIQCSLSVAVCNRKVLINELPDLTDLDDGDLKYKVDFKQVYATVLNKWLQADDKSILEKAIQSSFVYINYFLFCSSSFL